MGRKSTAKMRITILALALLLSISLAYAASFSSTETNPPMSVGIVQAGGASQFWGDL